MRKKPSPKVFEVLSVSQVTPNMRNVSIGGPAMDAFPTGQDGGYVKLLLSPGGILSRGLMRTYTIRRQSAERLDIEFALHGAEGEGGPAVEWAMNAKPGDEIALGGPGPAKLLPPDAESYFVVGDMTALPAIAVNLAQLRDDAKGDAVIEVRSEEDRQDLKHPSGVRVHWLYNAHPGENTDLFEEKIRSIPWPQDRVYAWSASEFDMMRKVRAYLRQERGLQRDQLYISSYWKKGMDEESHRNVKREDATAHS
ncbi:MAG: siderophore-interacting protein [Pseudomonadota bacterium]